MPLDQHHSDRQVGGFLQRNNPTLRSYKADACHDWMVCCLIYLVYILAIDVTAPSEDVSLLTST